jgi:hypothetical protein
MIMETLHWFTFGFQFDCVVLLASVLGLVAGLFDFVEVISLLRY